MGFLQLTNSHLRGLELCQISDGAFRADTEWLGADL